MTRRILASRIRIKHKQNVELVNVAKKKSSEGSQSRTEIQSNLNCSLMAVEPQPDQSRIDPKSNRSCNHRLNTKPRPLLCQCPCGRYFSESIVNDAARTVCDCGQVEQSASVTQVVTPTSPAVISPQSQPSAVINSPQQPSTTATVNSQRLPSTTMTANSQRQPSTTATVNSQRQPSTIATVTNSQLQSSTIAAATGSHQQSPTQVRACCHFTAVL